MHKELVLNAFEKAKKEAEIATGIVPSITALSKHISDYMFEECKFQYHEKSLRNKYKLASSDTETNIELKSGVVNCLCQYLGYGNYAEFIRNETKHEETISLDYEENFTVKEEAKKTKSINEKLKIVIQKNKVTLIFCSLLLFMALALFYTTRQRWMVWQGDHYLEVSFDIEKYELTQLKLYSKERIDFFKKITPTCDYSFFKEDGRENLWYEKSISGKLEYFTAPGLHPETGKTLKKITVYIIQKYLCESYRK